MTRSASTKAPIILAAGGTGGHLFPAEALAHALVAAGRRVVVIGDARGQIFATRVPGLEHMTIRSATDGPGIAAKAKAAVELALGYRQARRLLASLRPAVVVGFGGYPSVPTVMAAGHRGTPVLLHEQNAHLGRANRLLARRAAVIAGAFPKIAGVSAADTAKLVHVGNPVRPTIAALHSRRYDAPGPIGPVRLLVLGGSQGARIFSDIVAPALAMLPQFLRSRLAVSQQCRPEDLERVAQAYADTGIDRTLKMFFDDVPDRLAQAHLVIARSGASTTAELAAAGRPALLVPYPFATDDHQTANAAALAAAGGALVMPQSEFTVDALADRLRNLLGDPIGLGVMAAAARRFGRPEAAQALAAAVLDLAGNNGDAVKEAAE